MANIRVYDLAKQLGLENKALMKILADNGIEKKPTSSITEEEADIARKAINGLNGQSVGKSENVKADKKTDNKSENKKSDKKSVNEQSDKKKEVVNSDKKTSKEASNTDKKNTTKDNNDGKKAHITQVYNPQNSTNNSDAGKKNNGQNKKNDFNSNNQNRNNNGNNQNNKNNGNNQKNKNNGGNSNNVNNQNNNQNGNQNNRNNNQNRNNNNNNQNNKNNGNNRNNGNNQNNRNNRNNNQNNNNSYGKNNGKNNNSQPVKQQPVKEEETIKEIILPETLTIKELADKMKIQPSALVKKLFMQGQIVTINQEIDFDTAQEIALEYDIIAEQEEKVDIIEELLREDEEDESKLVKRPPVVCVMGHVDHGKTSLLDAIRQTNVIAKEAGGITQHIGAYTVTVNGEQITFLDTPGHEAFTAMRMRGAQSTDIAILVVAADDGVMPQTVEAINHAKAAGISIIVAVNKIDKPSANIDKVKQELAEYELVAEDWGGDTIFVPVSAHTKEGIDTLLEMILLEAEVCELKANPDRKARGLVIEAQLDKGRGPVATVLVQKGTLHVGDAIAAGSFYGKVRAMVNDKRMRVNTATPSTPVEILGLNGVPNAGEVFVATENDKEARNFAETFIKDGREKLLEGSKAKAKMSLDDLFNQIQEGELKELDLIVKADVQGSVEAVKNSLTKLSNDEVVVKVIHAGVGAINESDVILASASNAIIIGFNVRPDNLAKEIAEREKVDLRLYRVIYQAIADVEAAMKGMLDPVFEEKVIGHAEVRQLFKASGVGTIAGSYVLDGVFQRGCNVRITREGEQIFEGALASLKRFKDDVKEVKSNYECGLVFEKFNDVKEGDIVEAYIMQEVPR
ncbi:MAG: translation initiation factor IF-2 [Eubacteriales bacterium]|nr:translation initiation factor IF-2 [Eubacteriales bacterium]